jgi:hypothetical protein
MQATSLVVAEKTGKRAALSQQLQPALLMLYFCFTDALLLGCTFQVARGRNSYRDSSRLSDKYSSAKKK